VPTIDVPALVKGAAVAIAVCLPVALVSEIVVDRDDPSGWAIPLYLGVLVGFVLAGAVASREATAAPLVTGALAALAGFAVIQGIGIVVRLVGDDDVMIATVVFSGLLAYGCGLTGAVVGERRRARR